METIQRCDDKSSTFEYDSRSTQCPVIMDHPYAQEILLPISVRDVGTSPINFFQHSGKLSGIETLRSSVDSKARSSRSLLDSGKLSGIHTLGSSFSNEGNARITSRDSNVRSDIGKGLHKQLTKRGELNYIDAPTELAYSFSSPRTIPHCFHTPELATHNVKNPDLVTERLDASSMIYRHEEFVSPTFSKVITSTPREPPCERNENKDVLSHTINLDAPNQVDEPGETDVSTVRIGSIEVKQTIDRSFSKSPRLLDNAEDDVSSDDDSAGGLEFLNDLTIFEYFDKFDEISNDGSFLVEEDPLSSSETNVPVAEPCVEGHCIEVLDKEALQIRKKKVNARRVNKKRKERGLSYVRKDGTKVPAREIKPTCDCKLKCSKKYPENIRQKFLDNLLRLKMDSQNQFLANHITVKRTARPQVVNSRRSYTRVYKLPGVKGTVKVCKTMFQATFDIGCRKMRTLAARVVAGSGVPTDDGRQRNSSRQPVSQEHLSNIKQHILSFPAYSSHYTREKSSRLYLSSDLSIRRMYELYQNKCAVDNLVPVHCRNFFHLLSYFTSIFFFSIQFNFFFQFISPFFQTSTFHNKTKPPSLNASVSKLLRQPSTHRSPFPSLLFLSISFFSRTREPFVLFG
ncbi:uncharacterized protein LOC115265159 isoform X2 [Aedes albopictus]